MLSSREVIKRLRGDGWSLDRVKGDHYQFRHPTKPGTVTVQHPKKDLDILVIKSIERQAGIRLR